MKRAAVQQTGAALTHEQRLADGPFESTFTGSVTITVPEGDEESVTVLAVGGTGSGRAGRALSPTPRP